MTSFTLYTWDIKELIEFIKGADTAAFDVDEDGYVHVHVAGKDKLTV